MFILLIYVIAAATDVNTLGTVKNLHLSLSRITNVSALKTFILTYFDQIDLVTLTFEKCVTIYQIAKESDV